VAKKKKAARKPSPSKRLRSIAPVAFVESMETLGVTSLPQGEDWSYEIKLDGYRLEVVKNFGEVRLYSRRKNLLTDKYPYIGEAFAELADGTIVDGELVALDSEGHADFHRLQNFKSASESIRYVAFDLLAFKGESLLTRPLWERRQLLKAALPEHPRLSLAAFSPTFDAMMTFAKANALEGIIAKRTGSPYEAGLRSGAWQKHRFSRGQEFVVGGYTQGTMPFDALIVGFYEGKQLLYASRVRAGFVPASRREIFKLMQRLVQKDCPFKNLPEARAGRWGQGFTKDKMQDCVWLKPELVVRIDFLEWTDATHLRHPKYIGVRDDKSAPKVVREIT
jgi:bifunctional non-homologous end joining protein LigD